MSREMAGGTTEEVPAENGHEQHEQKEKGRDVKIIARYIRHGERTKEGVLTDYGREVTRLEAQKEEGVFDVVKAYGSQAGPKNQGMGRSLETAHIYANEIAEGEAYKTRPRNILSYETILTPPPYDHTILYNQNLPPNFEELSDEEKAEAAERAQQIVTDHVLSLTSPEAIAYRKEIAGAFASDLLHLQTMSRRLKSGSRILSPRGTHSPMPEFLLSEALVIKYAGNSEAPKMGFDHTDQIGGPLKPSEAFSVDVRTDEEGNPLPFSVSFGGAPGRPVADPGDGFSIYLDRVKVEELAEYYNKLHERNPAEDHAE